jgi:hypothetical protein
MVSWVRACLTLMRKLHLQVKVSLSDAHALEGLYEGVKFNVAVKSSTMSQWSV